MSNTKIKSLKVTRLAGRIGARIEGVKLSDNLDPAVFEEIIVLSAKS